MAEFESFSTSESVNQGSNPESFRLFQERMKAAAAQIKAIKAGERKQKKKEDDLVNILSEFIKSHQSQKENVDFLFHISKLLSFNCPAAFILGGLLLNFPELQVKTGFEVATFEEAIQAGALENNSLLPDLYFQDNQLNPSIRIAIDSWIKEISEISSENRDKLLKNCLAEQSQWKPAINEFMSFSLNQYLSMFNIHLGGRGIENFMNFVLKTILERIQKPFTELQ